MTFPEMQQRAGEKNSVLIEKLIRRYIPCCSQFAKHEDLKPCHIPLLSHVHHYTPPYHTSIILDTNDEEFKNHYASHLKNIRSEKLYFKHFKTVYGQLF